MHTVWAIVSKSPLIMKELRKLHQFIAMEGKELQMRHLPSALNLYADCLSRRRIIFDYLPRLGNIPEHWWKRDSEHEFKQAWTLVKYLRPPLEFLPLVPRKIARDDFKGLILMPWWERQNWHQEICALDSKSWVIEPKKAGSKKQWHATLVDFSKESSKSAAMITQLNVVGWEESRDPFTQTRVVWRKGLDS